jgi:hypothetical protein
VLLHATTRVYLGVAVTAIVAGLAACGDDDDDRSGLPEGKSVCARYAEEAAGIAAVRLEHRRDAREGFRRYRELVRKTTQALAPLGRSEPAAEDLRRAMRKLGSAILRLERAAAIGNRPLTERRFRAFVEVESEQFVMARRARLPECSRGVNLTFRDPRSGLSFKYPRGLTPLGRGEIRRPQGQGTVVTQLSWDDRHGILLRRLGPPVEPITSAAARASFRKFLDQSNGEEQAPITSNGIRMLRGRTAVEDPKEGRWVGEVRLFNGGGANWLLECLSGDRYPFLMRRACIVATASVRF